MLPKFLAVLILTAAIAVFEPTRSYAIWFFLIGLTVAFVIEGVRVVPQQNAWVVERLGRFHAALEPGLNIIVPFVDRVAYRHSLKEVPLEITELVLTTIKQDATADGSLILAKEMLKKPLFSVISEMFPKMTQQGRLP